MTKSDIIAELPRLSIEDRAEVQAKLDELAGNAWEGRDLTDEDREALDTALGNYAKSPDAGSCWEDVKARIHAKLH